MRSDQLKGGSDLIGFFSKHKQTVFLVSFFGFGSNFRQILILSDCLERFH